MNKPVTAQELIDLIEKYQKHGFWRKSITEADDIIRACRAYLEEKENGTR